MSGGRMPLFLHLFFFYTIAPFIHHSFINICWCPSPYLHSCRLSGRTSEQRFELGPASTNWATLHPDWVTVNPLRATLHPNTQIMIAYKAYLFSDHKNMEYFFFCIKTSNACFWISLACFLMRPFIIVHTILLCVRNNRYPEIEVTDIILAKVSRPCQLSSRSCWFLSRVAVVGFCLGYRFLNP